MALGIKIPKGAFAAGKQKLADGDDFNNVELEPGRYTCILKKGRAVSTANGPQIVFDMEVAGEADKKGGSISVFFSLNEDRIVWLFRLLALLGYDVDNLDEAMLEEILNDIATNTPVVRVTASQKGDFINYRIDKLMSELTAADARGGAEAGETENAADEGAAGGKAGIKPGAHAKAKAKPAPAEETVDDQAEEPPKAKPGLKKKAPEPEPEPEPAAEEEVVEDAADGESEVELKVGMQVTATLKGVKQKVKVTAIEDDNKVVVETKDKKKFRTSIENLEL
jgi:hypothetical protein